MSRHLFQLGRHPVSNTIGFVIIGIMAIAFIASIAATYRLLQIPQTIDTQASEVFTSHAAYASDNGYSFVFSAVTAEPADVFLHIDPYDSFTAAMSTTDGINHSVFIADLPEGTYTYSFSAETETVTSQSEAYPFVVPQFASE